MFGRYLKTKRPCLMKPKRAQMSFFCRNWMWTTIDRTTIRLPSLSTCWRANRCHSYNLEQLLLLLYLITFAKKTKFSELELFGYQINMHGTAMPGLLQLLPHHSATHEVHIIVFILRLTVLMIWAFVKHVHVPVGSTRVDIWAMSPNALPLT